MNSFMGHILKFKDEQGNWVSIPILVSGIYSAYVKYCTDNNITPVSQDVYYQTIGSLQTLVNQLAGGADAANAIVSALGSGALPTAMGGLGVTISNSAETYVLTVTEPDDWDTNYSAYYTFDGTNYIALTSKKTWASDTYYSKRNVDYQGTLFGYLTEILELVDLSTLNKKISDAIEGVTTGLKAKADASDFSEGDSIPDENTPGKYYFQYKVD